MEDRFKCLRSIRRKYTSYPLNLSSIMQTKTLLPILYFLVLSCACEASSQPKKLSWSPLHPIPPSWAEYRKLIESDVRFTPPGNFSQPHVPRRLLDDLVDPKDGKVLLLHAGRCGSENLLMMLKDYCYVTTEPIETLQTAKYNLDKVAKYRGITEKDRNGLVNLVTERLLASDPKHHRNDKRILSSAKTWFGYRRRLTMAEILQAHWNAGYRQLVIIVRSPVRREVSSIKARITHVYETMEWKSPCESVKINTSLTDMLRYWETVNSNHAAYGEALQFPLFRKLLLSYDYDMYTDSRVGLMLILDFLGHPAKDLSAASATEQQAKLNDCPLSVTLSNYDQMRKAFRGTFHERFLEDQTDTSLAFHRYLYALCQSTWKASHRYGKYAVEVQEASAIYNELVQQRRAEWGS